MANRPFLRHRGTWLAVSIAIAIMGLPHLAWPQDQRSADVVIAGATIPIDGGRLRFPSIAFSADASKETIAKLALSADRVQFLEVMKTLKAQTIKLPELAIEVQWQGLGQRVTCRDIVLSGVAKAVVKDATVGSCVWLGEQAGIAGTIRRGLIETATATGLDMGVLLAPDIFENALRKSIAAMVATKIGFYGVDGRAVTADKLALRVSKSGEFELSLDAVQANGAKLAGGHPLVFTAEAATLADHLSGPSRFVLEARAAAFAAGTSTLAIGKARVEAPALHEPSAWSSSEPTAFSASLAHDMAALTALSIDDAKADLAQANLGNASGRARWSLASFVATRRLRGGESVGLDAQLRQFVLANGLPASSGAMLTRLGYDTLRIDGSVAVGIDPERRLLNLDTLSLTLPDIGAFSLSARLADVSADIASRNAAQASAAMQAAKLTSLRLSLTNLGLAERLAVMETAKDGRAPKDVRATYAALLSTSLRLQLGAAPATQDIAKAIAQFIENPKTMMLDIAVADPPVAQDQPTADRVAAFMRRLTVTSKVN